jgi:ankyrin repeat protein
MDLKSDEPFNSFPAMKTKILIVAAFAAVGVALAADAINEALQKGLLEEEANHDLEAAIQAYQSVINQYDDQRKIAATAVFRLAECYRKQGKTNEAVGAYQRVIQDFADQSNLTGPSEKNLAALGRGGDPRPGGTGNGAIATVTDPDQLKLLNEEIKLVEADLAAVEARMKTGKAGLVELVKPKRELLLLRRQLPENAGLTAQKSVVEQQIQLVEQLLVEMKKRVEVGATAPLEVVPLERELLGLKRELIAVSKSSVAARGSNADGLADVSDQETKEIQRLKDVIKNSPDLINAKGGGGDSPLHNAARDGQLAVARFLLDNAADVNARNNGGASALHLAAARGYKAMAELLLSKGAAVNAKDVQSRAPLHTAAANGFVALAKTLMENQADVNAKDENNATPLHWAVENGFKDTVALLLAKKADPNISSSQPVDAPGRLPSGRPLHILGGTPLDIAVRRGQSEDEQLVELLLKGGAQVNAKDPFGLTPLLVAVQSDNQRIVKALLLNDADVNARDDYLYTPLHWAIRPGNQEMIESLLAHKASADAKDKAGETPLYFAVRGGDKAVVELLLARGADVNVQDVHGFTPLHRAIETGNKDMVESLLAHKADVNAKSKAGETPLHAAVGHIDRTIVELLLARGADVNARNNEAQTPLDLVTKPGVPAPGVIAAATGGAQQTATPEEIAKLLRKHGAKE